MAQQPGNIKITGTIDNLTFYKIDDIYYVQKKSSFSRKKVLTSPAFENTRVHASEFSLATKLASRLYRPLKKEEKSIKLFRKMVGRAKTLLHKGTETDQIIQIIKEELLTIKDVMITTTQQAITPIFNPKPTLQPTTPKTEKTFSEINTPELSYIYVDNKGNLQSKQLNISPNWHINTSAQLVPLQRDLHISTLYSHQLTA